MMGMSLSMPIVMSQQQRLSLTQRNQIRLAQLLLTQQLVSALADTLFENNTHCSKCGRRLTLLEVVRGWRDDPNDITTECPQCKHRFFAKMRRPLLAGSAELTLYCPLQTLARLTDYVSLNPEELERKNSSIFFSAKFHFGSITNSMSVAGFNYRHEEVIHWEDKVAPFLGKMADTEIALHCNQPASKIRALRVKKGIRAYSKRNSLE